MQQSTHGMFRQIVQEGVYLPNGMPRWDDVFGEAEVNAIHAYLIALQERAHADYRRALEEGRDPDVASGATGLQAH